MIYLKRINFFCTILCYFNDNFYRRFCSCHNEYRPILFHSLLLFRYFKWSTTLPMAKWREEIINSIFHRFCATLISCISLFLEPFKYADLKEYCYESHPHKPIGSIVIRLQELFIYSFLFQVMLLYIFHYFNNLEYIWTLWFFPLEYQY